MKMGLMFSTEGYYIFKVTTSNNNLCYKLKEHLHYSSWFTIKDEPYRMTAKDESNFFHIFSTLITIIYLKMAATELVRLGIDAVC